MNKSDQLTGEEEQIAYNLLGTEQKPSIRQTNLRWVMLLFGCIFLMGSYFCYDIPGVAQTTFESEPYDLSALQVNLMYIVYAVPNTVLPLLGGIFLDKIGIRIGLLLFTSILTVGQFVYAIGGTKNVYWVMLAGRVIFGLGGECMSVGQSAIIANWFKGKELALALGLNLTFARLASVFGGIIIPRLITADDDLINSVMWTGTGLCVVSLIAGILLVLIDSYADRTDKKELALSADDKFQLRDILEFELPFWLVCVSCVFVYMSIFPFIQVSNTFLQEQFGFDKNMAGTLYSVPYFMSAALSPILGYLIDRVGKRAIFITTSSVLVALACFLSAMLPTYDSPNYSCLLPLILVGFGYSIYASALWSSIPYIVKPKTIGSAFGLATSVQQIGLVIAPFITGVLENKHPGKFASVDVFLGSLSLIGAIFNVWLYLDDIKNRGGVLNNVAKPVQEMMTSPEMPRRDDPAPTAPVDYLKAEAEIVPEGTVVFEMDPNARQALKRSIGKLSGSFAK